MGATTERINHGEDQDGSENSLCKGPEAWHIHGLIDGRSWRWAGAAARYMEGTAGLGLVEGLDGAGSPPGVWF